MKNFIIFAVIAKTFNKYPFCVRQAYDGKRMAEYMKTNKKSLNRVFAGLLTGIINGLFGGGGGMVAVPLMKNLLGYDEKRAHATAILVIAPVCAASAVTYIINGYFAADVILPAAIGSVAGGLAGAELLDKLPEFWVNAVFLAVMLAAGLRMLF